ncbi:MAG: DUF4058 family protein [Cyanobacteria bacterium P01_A01_bin.114]
MPSPFPGMDPYLEHPEIWPGVIDIYDRNAYDLKLDYRSEPIPALTDTESQWVDTLLKKQHLR